MGSVAYTIWPDKRTVAALNKQGQIKMGERYEIFNVPGDSEHEPALALRYYGPLDSVLAKTAGSNTQEQPIADELSTLQRIQRIARLAKENGIDSIVVGSEFGRKLGVMDAPSMPASVLVNSKRIKTENDYFDAFSIIAKSPEAWLALTDPTELNRTQQYVDSLVAKLRTIHPTHPVLAAYDTYTPYLQSTSSLSGPDNPTWQLRTKHMIAKVQEEVERYQSEIFTQAASKSEKIDGADPRPHRWYAQARFNGIDLELTHNGQTIESRAIAVMTGLTRRFWLPSPRSLTARLKQC